MDIRILKYFITIAECQSFSKASNLLHITQPTLSRQIGLLEDELGSRLFLRTKPYLDLTLAGKLCLEKSIEIVSIYDDITKELLKIKKGVCGEIKIGYTSLSQFEILSRTLSTLKKSNPEIEISIFKKSIPECEQELLEGKLDLAFNMYPDSRNLAEIGFDKFTDGQLYAVVPANHPLKDYKSLKLNELKDEDLVIFEREQAPELFDNVTALCNSNGFTAKFSAKGKDMESLMMLVGIGEGIALMDETAKILESEHTKFIPLEDCKDSYAWYIIWIKNNHNPCIPLIVETIKLEKENLRYV